MDGPILFYDGDCGLCDATVRFVLRHERGAEFRFAPLQAPLARRLLAPHGVAAGDLSSMLVLEGGRLWRESDAAARILRRLRMPWRLLAEAMALCPRGLRDRAYRFVGRRRHRWFGRSRAQACPVAAAPASAAEVRERFLG